MLQPEVPTSVIGTAYTLVAAILGTGTISSIITIWVKDWLDRRREAQRALEGQGESAARARAVDGETVRKTSETVVELFGVINDQSKTISAERLRADRSEVKLGNALTDIESLKRELKAANDNVTASYKQMQALHAAAALKEVRLGEFSPQELKAKWNELVREMERQDEENT